jgi:hypothetical protein
MEPAGFDKPRANGNSPAKPPMTARTPAGAKTKWMFARWTSGKRDLKWRANYRHVKTHVAVWRNKCCFLPAEIASYYVNIIHKNPVHWRPPGMPPALA